MQRLFSACADDPACNQTYPNLQEMFYSAIARLEDAPMVIPVADDELYPDGVFLLNSAELVYAFYRSLSNTAFLWVMPLFVREGRALATPS